MSDNLKVFFELDFFFSQRALRHFVDLSEKEKKMFWALLTPTRRD